MPISIKSAEVDHILHFAFDLHAWLEVLEAEHAILQKRRRQVFAWVAVGFFELGDDVVQCDIAYAVFRLERCPFFG